MRKRQPLREHVFLQQRLGLLVRPVGAFNAGLPVLVHHTAGRFQTTIEIQRTEKGFHRVRTDAGQTPDAGIFLMREIWSEAERPT